LLFLRNRRRRATAHNDGAFLRRRMIADMVPGKWTKAGANARSGTPCWR